MGAQLNIKNPSTVRLARKLAEADGTTMTQAVHAALEQVASEREAHVQQRIAEFNTLVEDLRGKMTGAWGSKTSKELMDELYDESGLPG